MEAIRKNDIYFLVALNASEESSIVQLQEDICRWSFNENDVVEVISTLIVEGVLLFSEFSMDKYEVYTTKGSHQFAQEWKSLKSNSLIIFLTDRGWSRWDEDDWGITTERARYLMFSNQQRIQNA